MGTSDFETLFKLKGQQRIIIIDGVINCVEADGTLFHLPASEINARIQDDPILFFEWYEMGPGIELCGKLMGNEFPGDKIDIYLVAISEIKINMELSDAVKSREIN